MKKITSICLAFFLFAALNVSMAAQNPVNDLATLKKGESRFGPVDRKLDSKLMGREMPYRVVLPPEYSFPQNSEKRYAVVFLLHGLSGHFDNWTARTKLAEYATSRRFIIVTPEGGDGWYTDSVSAANDR